MPSAGTVPRIQSTRGKDTLIDVMAVKPKSGELRIFRVGADGEKGDFSQP